MKSRVALSLSLTLMTGIASAQQINRVIGRSGESHRVEDATVLANNDIALAGERSFFSPYTVTATVSRTAPDGEPIWTFSIDVANEFDTGFGVRELSDNSMFFGFHTGNSNQAVGLARLTSAGTPIWIRNYPGGSGYGAAALEIDKTISGDFAMIANRFNASAGSSGQLLRIDTSTGVVASNRSYDTDGISAVSAHFNDIDFVPATGDYYVTGAITRVTDEDQYDTDVLVARINRTTGQVVWANAYSLPPGEDFPRSEEGYSIELASDGSVFVVARSDNPVDVFGPPGVLHLRLSAALGVPLAISYLSDVQPSYASLENLANGYLLASGNRIFGDGQAQAQMWEIDPVTAFAEWRAEYGDGSTRAGDAVEHITPSGSFLFLTGSNSPFSIPGIGNPDQMFLQTDASGDDGCSSTIWIPPPQVPDLHEIAVTLIPVSVVGPTSIQTVNTRSTLESAIVCRAGACVGDLNNDGVVDDADFVIFVVAYNILDCADPTMPAGCPADFNFDGIVDDADFSLFVPAYNEFVCPGNRG